MTQVAAALSQASGELVIDAGARLGTAVADWQFVPAGRPFLVSAVPYFESVLAAAVPTADQVNHFAEYLALSHSCHDLDGWRYLSQAAVALLRGARGEALHLAYYAELRAAMSILAGAGVGMLKKQHFALTDKGQILRFNGATHEKTWEAILEWAKQPAYAQCVIESLKIAGIEGQAWVDASGSTSSIPRIGEEWLADWAYDLSVFADDRDLRNEASYRPDLTGNRFSPLSELEYLLVRDVADSAISPAGGPFFILDLALVRHLLATITELTEGAAGPAEMKRTIDNVREWFEVIEGISKSDLAPLIHAVETADAQAGGRIIATANPSNTSPTGVFTRAFLLLRLATALKRRNWTLMSRRAPGGVAPWQGLLCKYYSEQSCIWDTAGTPPAIDQLGEDFALACQDLDEWRVGKPFNPYQLWRTKASQMMEMSRFERLAVLACSA